MNIRRYLGTKDFYKETAIVAIPIALQSLITIGVNLVDNIMLGSLGEIDISACALAVQYIGFYTICCMGLGMGASVMVSRFFGMKDFISLKKSVTLMIRFTFFIGLLFTFFAWLTPTQIMRLYTPDTLVIEEGVRYLNWSVPTFLLMGFVTTISIVLRSTGQMGIPLIVSCLAFFINIGANWIFIFGKLGVPAMGIEGAAIGTLISRAFEFSLICGYFFFVDKTVRYRIRNIFMKCSDLVKEYFRISLPVLVSDMLLGLGMNVVAMVMGRIGPVFVSANSITTVTQQLSTALIQGICQAGCIVTGHSLGRGEYEKAREQGWTFLLLGLVIGMLAGFLIIGIGDFIISFYNITDETKEVASSLMRAIGVIVIFQSANSILTKGVLRGGGDTKVLMIADNIFLWAVSIPLGYVAGLVLGLSPFWIYFCLKIDQFLKTFWCVLRLKSGKWVKKIEGAKSTTE